MNETAIDLMRPVHQARDHGAVGSQPEPIVGFAAADVEGAQFGQQNRADIGRAFHVRAEHVQDRLHAAEQIIAIAAIAPGMGSDGSHILVEVM